MLKYPSEKEKTMKFTTKTKRSIARSTGIPTTKSGRKRKAQAQMGCLAIILTILLIVATIVIIL